MAERQRPPKAPAARAAYHHGNLRRALLDATLDLVARYGPEGFTLRATARAAGVSPGAPYHHFADKDALLTAVAEEGFAAFGTALRQAADAPAASARARAHNVGAAYVRFALEHPTHFRVMLGQDARRRLRHRALGRSARATYELVRAVLVAGIGDGAAVPEAVVLGWWSVVHGLAFLAIDGFLGGGELDWAHQEAPVRQVLEALDSGALAGAPRPRRR